MLHVVVVPPNYRVVFICLTQVVLITVLTSILSNQFAKYNARDQYHFLFGILSLFPVSYCCSVRMCGIDQF